MLTPGAAFALHASVLFGCALGIFLLVEAVTRRVQGPRALGLAVVPAAGGVAFLATFALLHVDEVRGAFTAAIEGTLFPDRLGVVESRIMALGVVAAGIGAAELLVVNGRQAAHALVRGLERLGSLRARPWVPDAVVLVVIVGVLGVVLAVPSSIEARFKYDLQRAVGIAEEYELPGEPMGLVMASERDGYITFGDGQIAHFRLPDDPEGELAIQFVAALDAPRGMAILEGTLYVTDSGPSVCRGVIRDCEVRPVLLETEQQALGPSSGSVVAFPIRPDGSLGERRDVVTGLPVATFRHGLNSVVAGPDGYLYVVSGGFDHTFGADPSLVATVDRDDLETLGTVMRIAPDGSSLEIFVRGLRNVYDIVFDGQGRLFGIDNDGPTARSARLEEVMRLREGEDHGYPYRGSLDVERQDSTLWYLEDVAAASGLEWGERVGLGPGLVVGSFGRLDFIGFDVDERGYFVDDEDNLALLLEVDGFLTSLDAAPDGRLFGTLFGSVVSPRDSLVVFDIQQAEAEEVVTEATIQMHDNRFTPNRLRMPADERLTINYENLGAIVHNLVIEATDQAGQDFQSPPIVQPGEAGSFEAFFMEAGDYSFVCTLHPGMAGTMTVE